MAGTAVVTGIWKNSEPLIACKSWKYVKVTRMKVAVMTSMGAADAREASDETAVFTLERSIL